MKIKEGEWAGWEVRDGQGDRADVQVWIEYADGTRLGKFCSDVV